MPQPLSRVKPDAFYYFGGNFVQARPQLVPYIMHVIHAWSQCDLSLTRFLTHILEADFQVVAAMMQAITSGEAKRSGIEGAVSVALLQEDRAIYQAVMKAVSPSRKVRNCFAHHIWALSPDLPDGLLLVDPKHLSKQHADYLTYDRAGDEERHNIKRVKMDTSNVAVWSEADFKRAVTEADRALVLIGWLGPGLRKDGLLSRAIWRGQLLAAPEVQQALKKLAR